MKTLLRFALILYLPLCASAAIIEKYVSNAGAGLHDGSSEANAFSWAEMITDINAGGKAGNRYNVKVDGTYTRTTTTDAISGSGTSTSPVIIRGYSSAITDGYQGRSLSGAGPLVTTNMPLISYTFGTLTLSGANLILESIRLTSNRNGAAVGLTGNDSIITRCAMENATSGASGTVLTYSTNARMCAVDCDFTMSNGGGNGIAAVLINVQGRLIGCRIKSSAVGVTVAISSVLVAYNLVYECAGVGISQTSSTTSTNFYINNTVVGGSSDGIDIPSGVTAMNVIMGNMVTDNAGYGIDLNAATVPALVAYNRFRDNLGATNLGTDYVTATNWGNVTTDTGGPSTDYVDQPNDDYRLIAASPATSAGIPASASIGAYQRDQTGSGSGETSYGFVK